MMARELRSHRDASRVNWGCFDGVDPTVEQINLGTLQRIADATEQMARKYVDLLNEVERLNALAKERRERADRLERRIAALRGVITRLKRKGQA